MNEIEIWEKYLFKMDMKSLLLKILEEDNYGFVKLIWDENMDEIIRYGVNRIKNLAILREPNYELPADSFIEEAVKDILEAYQDSSYERDKIAEWEMHDTANKLLKNYMAKRKKI